MHAQAQGFPDGPKAEAHYYTLIQPYDDFGQPSMPEFYPDAALGVPEVFVSCLSCFLPASHPPPLLPLPEAHQAGARMWSYRDRAEEGNVGTRWMERWMMWRHCK